MTERIGAGWENLPVVDGQLLQRKRSAICYICVQRTRDRETFKGPASKHGWISPPKQSSVIHRTGLVFVKVASAYLVCSAAPDIQLAQELGILNCSYISVYTSFISVLSV